MALETADFPAPLEPRPRPFRRAVIRGLGVVLPPLLTIVIFVWIGSTVLHYVLEPIRVGVRDTLAWQLSGGVPGGLEGEFPVADERTYARVDLDSGEYVPLYVKKAVDSNPLTGSQPKTKKGYYQRYVEIEYLPPYLVIPLSLCLFILVLYLLGRFMAAGIGRVLWGFIESGVSRLPLVRNVYTSVKQVTDFMFSDTEIRYTRVVAIEYPRKGIWSLGLVTSESMLQIRDAAEEPVLALLIPSSPMPVTGYTITVKKSETVDLDITIDQALQYVVSCGVVVPPHQLQEAFDALSAASHSGDLADDRAGTPAVG